MKKYIILIWSFFMCFGVVGCSAPISEESESDSLYVSEYYFDSDNYYNHINAEGSIKDAIAQCYLKATKTYTYNEAVENHLLFGFTDSQDVVVNQVHYVESPLKIFLEGQVGDTYNFTIDISPIQTAKGIDLNTLPREHFDWNFLQQNDTSLFSDGLILSCFNTRYQYQVFIDKCSENTILTLLNCLHETNEV